MIKGTSQPCPKAPAALHAHPMPAKMPKVTSTTVFHLLDYRDELDANETLIAWLQEQSATEWRTYRDPRWPDRLEIEAINYLPDHA